MSGFPASQILVGAIFVVMVATVAAGALIAALTSRVIRSVSGLALCCIGLAGLYYFLHSPFLALMEILIYVGAVCVTIVFAIMLAEPEESVEQEKPGISLLWAAGALLVSVVIFAGVAWLGAKGDWPWVAPAAPPADGYPVKEIGTSLLTTYSMAFELISLVLLAAILGALAIAREGRRRA